MNCIIVSENSRERKSLELLIEERPGFKLLTALCSVKEAVAFMKCVVVDLLILDKKSPGTADLVLADSIPAGTLIICTGTLNSYSEHAKLRQLISFPEKFRGIYYRKCMDKGLPDHMANDSQGVLRIDLAGEDFFYALRDISYLKIFFKDITYIEQVGSSAVLHLENEKLITNMNLSHIQTFLPAKFQKISPTHIINIDHTILFDHQTLYVGQQKIRIKGLTTHSCDPGTSEKPSCKTCHRQCHNFSSPVGLKENHHVSLLNK
ncbi:LytTR family transcriptional regulator DNA-binding domain-containing protein [Mucilaginibacter sp. KACC 22773]|uniref:LytR/AlgR family response regulator transcription factor n=1 Tax=Mucilaginibacter sp. KACC 22773 TaxID=3025671 RepID=UPI0023651BD7|nr:LytTR family DNA-binding domain-containing protein [Mucilaginibacter sp. KACC 22773]WDF77106.1 LytTR family transcriptional regulator DNA-binding domain-containing protein [Mucilaginibacter sp. KACC 22773]